MMHFPDPIIEMVGEDSSTSEKFQRNKFYNPGSTISLTCIIRRHLIQNATVNDLMNVSWKKDGEHIDLQTEERIRKAYKCQCLEQLFNPTRL